MSYGSGYSSFFIFPDEQLFLFIVQHGSINIKSKMRMVIQCIHRGLFYYSFSVHLCWNSGGDSNQAFLLPPHNISWLLLSVGRGQKRFHFLLCTSKHQVGFVDSGVVTKKCFIKYTERCSTVYCVQLKWSLSRVSKLANIHLYLLMPLSSLSFLALKFTCKLLSPSVTLQGCMYIKQITTTVNSYGH